MSGPSFLGGGFIEIAQAIARLLDLWQADSATDRANELLTQFSGDYGENIERLQDISAGLPRYELGSAPEGVGISRAPRFGSRGPRDLAETSIVKDQAAVDPTYLGDVFDVGTRSAQETRRALVDQGIIPESYAPGTELFAGKAPGEGTGGRMGRGGQASFPVTKRGDEWGVGQTPLLDLDAITSGLKAGKDESLGHIDTGIEGMLATGDEALLDPGTLVERSGVNPDLSAELAARIGGISEASRRSSALAQQEIAGNVGGFGSLENVMREQNLADFRERQSAGSLAEEARGNIALEEAALQNIVAGLTSQEALINSSIYQQMMEGQRLGGSTKASIAGQYDFALPQFLMQGADLNRIIGGQNIAEKMTLAQLLGGLTEMEESDSLNAMLFKDESDWRRAQIESGLLGQESANLGAVTGMYSPQLIPQQVMIGSMVDSMLRPESTSPGTQFSIDPGSAIQGVTSGINFFTQ